MKHQIKTAFSRHLAVYLEYLILGRVNTIEGIGLPATELQCTEIINPLPSNSCQLLCCISASQSRWWLSSLETAPKLSNHVQFPKGLQHHCHIFNSLIRKTPEESPCYAFHAEKLLSFTAGPTGDLVQV